MRREVVGGKPSIKITKIGSTRYASTHSSYERTGDQTNHRSRHHKKIDKFDGRKGRPLFTVRLQPGRRRHGAFGSFHLREERRPLPTSCVLTLGKLFRPRRRAAPLHTATGSIKLLLVDDTDGHVNANDNIIKDDAWECAATTRKSNKLHGEPAR